MSIYVPALGSAYKSNSEYSKYFLWYREDSVFKYDYLLLSYPVFCKTSVKELGVRKNVLIIGDSGGFQILSNTSKGKSIRISQKEVLEWQQQNVDIGMVLDFPPAVLGGVSSSVKKVDRQERRVRMEKTHSNARWAWNNKTNERFKLYNICQGGTLSEIKEWYNCVTEHGNLTCDGIGIAPKPQKPLEIAKMLLFMIENNIENVHVLGVSGLSNIIPINYLSNYFKLLTYDSASYSLGTIASLIKINGHVNFPLNYGRRHKLKYIPTQNKYIRDLDLTKINDTDFFKLLNIFNLEEMIRVNRILHAFSSSPEMFRELPYIKDKTVLDFIDYGLKFGVENAVKKYKQYFNTSKQKTIF